MLYHTHIFQCSNIQINWQTKPALAEKRTVQPTGNYIDMFFLLKGHILSWPLLACAYVRKKKNHGVVAWLGFETGLCWSCNDQSSALRFYDTTSEWEVSFRLCFWSPPVFTFFPSTHQKRMCWEVSGLFSPAQPHCFQSPPLSTWTPNCEPLLASLLLLHITAPSKFVKNPD